MSIHSTNFPSFARLLLWAVCCWSALHASATRADENTSVPAREDLAETDEDFAFLGEFTGPISLRPNKFQPLALQIRPIGGNTFEALQFRGGLPGEKTHRREAVQLIGRRAGDVLILSGAAWAIFVEPDHCRLIDREGKQIGRLERVLRQSPTLNAQPPQGAIVLFDGTNTDQFTQARMTADGLLMEGADLKPMFQDFNMHVEFRLPYMPQQSGQARANSGLYLQSRYEVQVLDSFAELPTFNGSGSLYRYREPLVNMCLPPLTWQTYDVAFTAPRWAADGTKIRNARVTVWLNGVKVQNNLELENKTGAGAEEEPNLLPTRFQNHKDPVRFRNIWVVDRGLAPAGKFPVYPQPAEPTPAVATEAAAPAESQPAPSEPAANEP